jgi:hypothetical protein
VSKAGAVASFDLIRAKRGQHAKVDDDDKVG